MKVKDAMHVGVKWAEPDTSIAEIAHMMRCHDVGAIPIGQNDRLIGIVTDRDIICRGVADRKDLSALKARDIMTSGVVWCRDDDDLIAAVRRMEERRVRRMPVINAEKRMVGILALGDISAAASKALSGDLLGHVSAHH